MTSPARLYPPVPGPADRVHFLHEQRRHRRASRYYGVLGVLTALAAGVPLSLVVTPLVYLVLLTGLHVAELAGSVPSELSTYAAGIARAVREALGALLEQRWPRLDLATATALVLPGALVMLALWLAVRRLLGRAGARAAAVALHARPPAAGDFEEGQLRNLTEEMAVAAGLPPSRVELLDGTAANAAAIGTDPKDATLVVSRPLLEQLSRDETQAVVGHLVASVGNGDLRIATLLLSVQQALGLLRIILDAPFGGRSRRAIRRLFGARIPGGAGETDAARVAELLAGQALEMEDDLYRSADEDSAKPSAGRVLRWLLLLPLVILAATAKLTTLMMTGALFGPVFVALWRQRRRLADAMAVQLTRNPDALARALERLGAMEHHVAGGNGAAHLFVVWERTAEGKGGSRVFGGIGTLTPSISARRKALARMGAAPLPAGRSWRWKDYLTGASGTIALMLPMLVLVLAAVGTLALLAMLAANFLFLGLAVVAVQAAFTFLLGLLH